MAAPPKQVKARGDSSGIAGKGKEKIRSIYKKKTLAV